ncbi:hypothetical protein QYE76_054645 [Lolium multiflorum]|uniref:DUF1639 family protein n=1 Tax=Lolium multiflorum TaxID=4521 RepID=A0AAD8SZI4_LOLMU|nr:hypothetical protein QYE76_054645 [Lolium multiflorum]
MAATADPRAKASATQPRHLKPWAPPPAPPRGHRVPSLPAVSGTAAGVSRDRRRSLTSSHRRGGADAVHEEPYDGSLEDLRAKLMGHLHDAADRLRLPPAKTQPPPEPEAPPLPPPPEEPLSVAAGSMPWTLRERRRRPSARGSTTSHDDGVRAPFAVALEAEEIEDDVYALTGARPRRRPRKRPRTVQRQLDSLFPGLWLTEITADAYRVPDG